MDSVADTLYEESTDDTITVEVLCRCENQAPSSPPAASCETAAFAKHLNDEYKTTLRSRIDAADPEAIKACLEQVQAYNRCYRDLPCAALTERAWPAWLVGTRDAPCGCGVESWTEPHFFSLPTLPEALDACAGILITGNLFRPDRGSFDCSD